jgi:hypothetical protein
MIIAEPLHAVKFSASYKHLQRVSQVPKLPSTRRTSIIKYSAQILPGPGSFGNIRKSKRAVESQEGKREEDNAEERTQMAEELQLS